MSMLMRFVVLLVVLLSALSSALAADHQVRIVNFAFLPGALTVQAGDTVTWVSEAGTHNVFADNGSFTSGPPTPAPWTYSRTFHEPGEYGYYCPPHGAPGQGMFGRIVVEAGQPTFRINEGLNGIWHNPATSGQGWFFDVAPTLDQLFFAAWFTWTPAGGQHDWFTAQGRYEGNRAIVPLVRTRGGRFNANDPVTVEAAGEAEFVFESCSRAELRYRVDETGAVGVIPLERITPVPASCGAAQQDQD